ncbi:Protein of uncharacterised function (DUF1706) [Burkholderia pseudomallei]|nr:Protein of uncharacterised function (DUF1706) [Burkholderia pseudomallei]CAJ3803197.1 Protein of uncharacterised function (DUF1706) [Burkholderia pseudomallei]CAJ3839629.1 Protein of uncharacterised function (DUF1706) [Burkholderia pseudomallei]CAJ5149334.1 Protein of uncharacterised function (DUF1706) [Burkholderia pseudomallei]CAJ5743758.1 Protein of uncharacterised function (DUF1706) [Burkholderia pseudomallei]
MPPGHARGTLISTANLAAYRLGGNRLVLKWCDAHAHGRPVEPPETGYRWNRTGAPRADVPCRLRRRRLLELAAPARERARARRRAGRAESRRIAVWRVRGQTAHARADDSARHVVPVCQRACAAAQVEAGRRARVKAGRRTRSSAFVRVRPRSSVLVGARRRSSVLVGARRHSSALVGTRPGSSAFMPGMRRALSARIGARRHPAPLIASMGPASARNAVRAGAGSTRPALSRSCGSPCSAHRERPCRHALPPARPCSEACGASSATFGRSRVTPAPAAGPAFALRPPPRRPRAARSTGNSETRRRTA